MTIDEAIKINNETFHHHCFSAKQDTRNALKLGNEALKRFKIYQGYIDLHSRRLLPGETKD